jgi:hypothetical protein
MPSPDLSQGWLDVGSQLDAIKDYNATSQAEKTLRSQAANSASQAAAKISKSLNSIADQQKRFQRDAPTSMDELLNLFGKTNGQGPESFKYLRKKFLEASVKIEPEVKNIISKNALKALGCSQQQTFKGFSKSQYNQIGSMQQLPVQQGIYIPVQSLDFFGNLKNAPDTPVGKAYYEYSEPSTNPRFKPYGGNIAFPMNKELYQRMDATNVNRSYKQEYGQVYKGSSGQDLFDIQYTKTNENGVSGDYYRIILLDREDNTTSGTTSGNTVGATLNTVGPFLNDYFSTINMVDSSDIGLQIVNLLSGAVSKKAELGPADIGNQSSFFLIAQRILGLCFDSRKQIDVSGISKIAELDGVDDEFFKFTESDLRNINSTVNNVQNGVMEFIDCDNIKLPVDYESLTQQLGTFRAEQSGLTSEQKVAGLEKIIDSISQNPSWSLYVPANFNVSVSINTSVLKKIPLAVAASALSPKTLLPIFTMLSVLETSAKNNINQAITSANTQIASGNTIGGDVNNVINNGVDFLNKFRTFNINVISEIGAIYLKALFEILKKDIVNLLSIIIQDITKNQITQRYAIILRLINLALTIAELVKDYRECKSLLEDIQALLRLINGLPIKRPKIPSFLMPFTEFLPGSDPSRSSVNTLQFLQKIGVPTGTLPDGSPNIMNLFDKAGKQGTAKEETENGVSDAEVWTPLGVIPVFNKKR